METEVTIRGYKYTFQKQIGEYAYLYYCPEIDSKSIQFDPNVGEDVELFWEPINS